MTQLAALSTMDVAEPPASIYNPLLESGDTATAPGSKTKRKRKSDLGGEEPSAKKPRKKSTKAKSKTTSLDNDPEISSSDLEKQARLKSALASNPDVMKQLNASKRVLASVDAMQGDDLEVALQANIELGGMQHGETNNSVTGSGQEDTRRRSFTCRTAVHRRNRPESYPERIENDVFVREACRVRLRRYRSLSKHQQCQPDRLLHVLPDIELEQIQSLFY